MIAASEPLEFVPRGRQAVTEHPGPLVLQNPLNISTEPLLLYRLQNVNISVDDSSSEFWSIQEVFKNNSNVELQSKPSNTQYPMDFVVNAENELYVKGTTAVWTNGLNQGKHDSISPVTCFTCDTPIRYAFFCSSDFFKSENPDKRNNEHCVDENSKNYFEDIGICLIDLTSIRVYSPTGEVYRTSLEFPISNVWKTKTGLLLERNASSTTIENLSIPMPRLFSLTHPLNEMCPVLIKSVNGSVNFLAQPEYQMIFSNEESNLVLLYDKKIGKHFLASLRNATQEEKQLMGVLAAEGDETYASSFNITNNSEMQCFSQNHSLKVENKQKNITVHNKSRIELNSSVGPVKYHNVTPSSSNRSFLHLSYDRLQSTCGRTDQSDDIRKLGQVKPSKPVVPEFCLDHIWTENIHNKDYSEMAASGFIHTDLIDQKFVCYLLARSENLMIARLEKTKSSDILVLGVLTSIPAKDAVCLNALKLIAVLAPCGTLMIYSGSITIAKVHIGGILSNRQPHNVPQTRTSNSSFPRRSSLLPSVQTETSFADEVHLLSPVYPIQTQFPSRISNMFACCGLRDGAGNRLTLVYPGNSMYRISIPFLSECPLVSKCLDVLRQVLKKDLIIMFISKWYGVRNAPGSQDLNSEREWSYFQNVLLQLLGRPFVASKMLSSNLQSVSLSSSSEEPTKRRKTDNCFGSDSDYIFMQNHLKKGTIAQENATPKLFTSTTSTLRNDSNAPLFPYISLIFFSFHLLYEEMKLDDSLKIKLGLMAEFLNQLAIDLNLNAYCLHYFLDYPKLVYMNSTCEFTDVDKLKLLHPKLLSQKVPNVFSTINDWIDQHHMQTQLYPCISNVNSMSKNIVELTALISTRTISQSTYSVSLVQQDIFVARHSTSNNENKKEGNNEILKKLLEMDITRKDISRLPAAIYYLLAEELEKYRLKTPLECNPRVFELLLRPELYSNTICEIKKNEITYNNFKNENSLSPKVQSHPETNSSTVLNSDGMAHIHTKLLRLRFCKDLRIDEVRRLLSSANPVMIDLTQKIGVSDHDFIEEKEKQLLVICTRTMALPIARGMVTIRTSTPAATESLIIPKLCLSGKEKEKGGTIDLQQIELPQNMNVWPMFHNGVAAGLQLTPDCKDVDSTWIVYNKPKSQNEGSTEHAGFLMALGLNGHLKTLSFMSIYEYLVRCDEMTSLGLILGISAAHRGTMDTKTTKLLSVHIEALLPATALELDIPQNIQVAAIMGLGLLYQETSKRHIAEVLLQEIGRPPGPEMENCVERESYALTAGLALGLVTLGKGESPPGLKDLQLPDILHYYMVGGNKRPLTGSQKEKYKLQSFQVREGDTVNIDVTAPGATLALGLMFFQTGNYSVASWMNPPDTSYLLDLVRPDLLLLRILARGLIMWNDILPTEEWLNCQFPASLHFNLKNGPPNIDDSSIDHEALCQAYCNIITGGSLCIALRFAGTENKEATATLQKNFNLFLNMSGLYVGEYAGKSTVESCLVLILIALSLVNAGAGDLNILRTSRMLRERLGPNNSHVTYGSHMAIHMAIGFQFLGAGRFTLSRSPQAVAALICALFPKFPTHSNDNRYHLQAFRHLYVLAIEPRIVLPRDIDSGKLCLCNITYTTLDGVSTTKVAPCMLPEFKELISLRFEDPNYWPIKFERGKNWNQLEHILKKCDCIDIKQKAGCLSHVEDPSNLRSFFAQTLTTEQYSCWKIHPLNLMTFSNDSKVQNFINKFISNDNSYFKKQLNEELEIIQIFTLQFYHCLIKDTMHALSIYVDLLMSLQKMKTDPTSYDTWQLIIMQNILKRRKNIILLSSEHLNSLTQLADTHMENELEKHKNVLQKYIFSRNILPFKEIPNFDVVNNVAALITFYNLRNDVLNYNYRNETNFLKTLIELKKGKVCSKTVGSIRKILQINY